MPAVPVSQHSTAEKVVQWWAAKKQTHRPHLGASLIGHECDRYLWLTFRWAKLAEFEGRLLRLFDRGNREEPRIHEELRGIGVELHTMDGDTHAGPVQERWMWELQKLSNGTAATVAEAIAFEGRG